MNLVPRVSAHKVVLEAKSLLNRDMTVIPFTQMFLKLKMSLDLHNFLYCSASRFTCWCPQLIEGSTLGYDH